MPIKNASAGKVIAMSSRVAESFLERSLGLMFTRPSQAALILKFPEEQIIGLHMVFVFYPIDVLFVNGRKEVVDLIENFRPLETYTARRKALYAIELPAGTIRQSRTKVGHKIAFLSVRQKNHVNGRSITITKSGRLNY